MDNRKILDEVYRDFFGKDKEEKITPIDKEIEIKNMEELLIDEDSKELLKKIMLSKVFIVMVMRIIQEMEKI